MLTHRFLDKTGNAGTKFQLINGVFLLLSFFCARLIYGGNVSIHFIFTLAKEFHDIPWFYIVVYGGGTFILQGLNIFWCVLLNLVRSDSLVFTISRFMKMIAALRKRFDGQK